MTEQTHTPGPWHYDESSGEIYAADGRTILEASMDGPYGDDAIPILEFRTPADAALIAVAPEMYEALRLFMDFASNVGNIEKMIDCGLGDELVKASDVGIAALRKAEGEE